MSARERQVMWAPWTEPGLDHLRLVQTPEAVVADGLVVGLKGGEPFRARYAIRCDAAWRFCELRLTLLGEAPRTLALGRDERKGWTTGAGERLPALDDCLDIDISAVPFTNTLPIRRLRWVPGQSSELAIAYVTVPELAVKAVHQRYTCLETGERGGRFRYEGLESGFTAELPVDGDGLVLDYPGVFRRVWTDGR